MRRLHSHLLDPTQQNKSNIGLTVCIHHNQDFSYLDSCRLHLVCQPTPGTRRREPSAENPLRGTQHLQLGQPETEELKCHISLASILYIYTRIYIYIYTCIYRETEKKRCLCTMFESY